MHLEVMDCPGIEGGYAKVDLFVFSIQIAQISFEGFIALGPFKLRGNSNKHIGGEGDTFLLDSQL